MNIYMCDIGSHSGKVTEVLVRNGDYVSQDKHFITIEEDKTVVEVPAEFSGIIEKIYVKVGDTVKTGTLLVSTKEALENKKLSDDYNLLENIILANNKRCWEYNNKIDKEEIEEMIAKKVKYFFLSFFLYRKTKSINI